jgi:hypothetical protein
VTGPILAHAGAGATWQSLLVVVALGLTVVVLLAVLGKVTLEQPDDLVLPLAGVAIVSSLAPLGSYWLSDWIGWAFPLGVVMLATVLLTALTSVELTPSSPVTYGALALGVASAAVLYAPITRAWHPPPDFLPLAEDVEVAITAPGDGDEVPAGTVEVTVTVTDGSVQPDLVALDQLPDDPEEAGYLAVAVDGEVVRAAFAEDCTVDTPCTEVTFPVTVAPGDRRLVVEFRRGDGVPMTPLVTDAVSFTAR